MWIGLRQNSQHPAFSEYGRTRASPRWQWPPISGHFSHRSSQVLTAPLASGFTLIELMLVVSISIILATLASSELRRVTEMSREQSAIAQVRDNLYTARYRARREMVPTSFYISHGALVIENSQTGTQSTPLNAVIHHIDISTRDQKVTFTSGGGLTTLGTVTVSAVLRSGRTQHFSILPAIGSIREQ